jgi:2-keto-3-deoxy-L-rhamnonate aldolase RhmA
MRLPACPLPCLQAVLSVPGVDCCFMGPVDLTHALGLAQTLGFPACFDSPQFKASPT